MILQDYVKLKQINYSFKESKVAIPAMLPFALLIVFLQHEASAPVPVILTWFTLLTAILLKRWHNVYTFLQITDPTPVDISKHNRCNYIMLVMTSIIWSIGYGILIWYGDELSILFVVFFTLIYAGASILATCTHYPQYLALNLLPSVLFSILFIASPHPLGLMGDVTVLFASFFIYMSAYRYSKNFNKNLINTFKLERSKKNITGMLARAGEFRDEETGNHVLRMSHSSYLLALAFGLDEQKAYQIQQASLLHDLGKIGIPDNILLKPGKLTEAEMMIMQTHTQIGCDIIGESYSAITRLAKIIAISHHEKWDGSGYPHRLAGDEIPIEGRIVAICDVYDALTSSRPYKAPWPSEAAVEYITEHSGSHFDPQLVPLFLAILPEIIAFRAKNP